MVFLAAMVGKLGWTMGEQDGHQIRGCGSNTNQKFNLKHFLTGTMMHIEKENFKWTIVGFVHTEKRNSDWGHFKTILTMLVGVGRASIKQKTQKAVLHFFPSLVLKFWVVKGGNVSTSATGAYEIGPDSTQTNKRLPSETAPVTYAHDWALTCHSLWSGHHSARPFP